MVPNYEHNLRIGCRDKKNYTHQMAEVHFVQEVVQCDITSHLFYGFKDLHMLPHGNESRDKLEVYTSTFKESGRRGEGGDDIVKHISSNSIRDLCHPNIRVAFPGSREIQEYEDLGLSHEKWLAFVREAGDHSSPRTCVRNGAVAQRVTLAWSQKQADSHPKTKFHKGKKMPYPSFPEFRHTTTGRHFDVPEDLKTELAKVLSLGQVHVDQFFAEEDPMPDKARTRLFGLPFGCSFSKDCTSRFEFVDIFVESGAVLNRHMDYRNDHVPGYNYGASYSFVVKHEEGKLYRVNFIMCTRNVCGNFMKQIS